MIFFLGLRPRDGWIISPIIENGGEKRVCGLRLASPFGLDSTCPQTLFFALMADHLIKFASLISASEASPFAHLFYLPNLGKKKINDVARNVADGILRCSIRLSRSANQVEVLNPSKVPPLYINEEQEVEESLRLRYRYLDLRRPRMQENIALGAKGSARCLRENVILILKSQGKAKSESKNWLRGKKPVRNKDGMACFQAKRGNWS